MIIAVVHHAGGVGKTTTVLNLGYSLATAGQRVLLVDLDPQGDLTRRLNGTESVGDSLATALVTDSQRVFLKAYQWGGVLVSLIASDPESMVGVNEALMGKQMRELRLRRLLTALNATSTPYDTILLDCPPAFGQLTMNALYAADGVIIPVQGQDKGVRQLDPLILTLEEVQGYRGGPPAVLGFLLTMLDNTNQAQEAERDLRTIYGAAVFQTTIPRRTAVADDGRYQAPVAVYAPTNAAALAYTALAEEVLTHARQTTAA